MHRPAISLTRRVFDRLHRIAWLLIALTACVDMSAFGNTSGWGTGPSGPTGPFWFPEPAPIASALGFRELAAGDLHVCGVGIDDATHCWGVAFGDGIVTRTDLPPLASVASAHAYSCGVDDAGRAHCWSPTSCWAMFEPTSECGDGMEHLPDTLRFLAIAPGAWHTCGLLEDHHAVCWGAADGGRLGRQSTETDARELLPVDTDERFASLVAGAHHACALTDEGVAWCWGASGDAQTGSAATDCGEMQCTPVPTPVATELRFTSLALGGRHTCAIATDRRTYCWGYLEVLDSTVAGLVRRSVQPTPLEVPGALELEQLAAGDTHTCGLDAEGRAFCWGGENLWGERGTMERGAIETPAGVIGGHRFRRITAGAGFTCATNLADVAYCWGAAGLHLGR